VGFVTALTYLSLSCPQSYPVGCNFGFSLGFISETWQLQGTPVLDFLFC
jgi:hypothetical protein